jgi:hypothetical protein
VSAQADVQTAEVALYELERTMAAADPTNRGTEFGKIKTRQENFVTLHDGEVVTQAGALAGLHGDITGYRSGASAHAANVVSEMGSDASGALTGLFSDAADLRDAIDARSKANQFYQPQIKAVEDATAALEITIGNVPKNGSDPDFIALNDPKVLLQLAKDLSVGGEIISSTSVNTALQELSDGYSLPEKFVTLYYAPNSDLASLAKIHVMPIRESRMKPRRKSWRPFGTMIHSGSSGITLPAQRTLPGMSRAIS